MERDQVAGNALDRGMASSSADPCRRLARIGALAVAVLGMRAGIAGAADAGAKPASAPTPAAKPAGPSPFTDYTSERTGKRVRITPADLPPPGATKSADNPPRLVKRPKGALPQAPAGFKVDLYADGLSEPRLIRVAPNGDAFVVESDAGVMRVVRGLLASGRAAWTGVFAKGFKKPFGIAFYPPGHDPRWLYVANTDSVVRLPVQERRLEGARRGRDGGRGAARRRAAAGRRPLDARHRVLARRQAHVRLGRLAVERRRSGQDAGREGPRDGPGVRRPTAPDEQTFASGIRNAGRHRRSPATRASCGRRSTSATSWATTWSPTTSRTSRRAASTAGPGTTSAPTRIRGTRASTPS